ncbi:fatty acid-binding protein DegV [Gordonia iterans]|uniref:Fatty acid-binding protein DegV n=1 Tax=Gordonia iterans TaxID=1004901 RepID=A0A2S0KHN8_9ACTN|nr:DegV family protein [Gordonia iterans]AVM01194.1 fatty acid-binding protein DegV [Gordonia iterans]
MSVIVVTDSSSRLPASLADRYGITQVPLHVTMPDGSEYLEGVDPIPSEVIATPGVSTSGANPQDLEKFYAEALARSDGDGVVAVHMSRRLSGTWAAARLVSEEFGESLRIVDSRAAGVSVGLTVLAAAQAAEGGADRDQVYEVAVRAAATAESLLCVQTLENLRNSGRISAASHLLGSALSIKPILHMEDGVLALKERQRTTTKAINRMIDSIVEHVGADEVTVAVQHCQAPGLAVEVLERVCDRLPKVTSSLVVDLGQVLGVHVGRGAVGIATGHGLLPLD